MTRRTILGASLLILSMILITGLLTNDTITVSSGGAKTNPDHPNASLDPGFNGTNYSSQGSPRATNEILYGEKGAIGQSIQSGGTSTLSMDIPSGWNPIDLSTTVYQLYENRSFTRNPDLSSGNTSRMGYPNYWTNLSSQPTYLFADWNNGSSAQDVYMELQGGAGNNVNLPDSANWTQIIYVNGTNFDSAKLMFSVKRSSTDIGSGNSGKVNATVYINKVRVFGASYEDLTTSYVQKIVDVTSAVSSLPRNVNITLAMTFPLGHVKLSAGTDAYLYYDDVYLFINSTRGTQAVNLTLNGAPIVGQQYGTGTGSLHGALSPPFVFTSNTTGRVKFMCNSTINVSRSGQSDRADFAFAQGSQTVVDENVSKLSFFNTSNYILGSTTYIRDIINVSIPHDWTYYGITFPNGTFVSWLSLGLIQEFSNGSYSWIIMFNASGIQSYRPNPYTVMATSPNYLGSISTFRAGTGNWVAQNSFANASRISINGTVQGGSSSKGSAYVVFYNSSGYNVAYNMSAYAITPDLNGKVSFVFYWSNSNVSKTDLITLVLWENGAEVGVRLAPITFDLTPPQMRITLPTSNNYLRGMVNITVSSVDAHPKNMTLLINGSKVRDWSSADGWYYWNTSKYSDGPWELVAEGRDQVDNLNETELIVHLDNTPPSLLTSLPANNSYLRQIVPLSVSSCTDTNFKNVTLFINGNPVANQTVSPPGRIDYSWNTSKVADGRVWLVVRGWDLAGNVNETTRQVYVDNTAPVLAMTLSKTPKQVSGNSYLAGNLTLNILCTDTHFKNTSLLIDGIARENWTYENPAYKWNTTLFSDGVHTLTVVAWDLAGNSNQTTFFIIYVDNTPPTIPALSYPNDKDIINATTLALVWSDAVDEGSGVDHYTLEMDTSQYFNSSNHRVWTNIQFANFTIPSSQPLSNGTWYWRVRAVDRVGNSGQYTTARSFQVSLPGLPVALLVGIAGIVPATVILSSVILLRRRKKTEAEAFDRKKLIATFVFSKDGRCMFTHQFKEVRIEPQLLAGFLTAISDMMKEVVGGSGQPLSTIERPDAKILLEFGEDVTGALVAKRSSREYRRRLKAFLSRFEHDYAGKISGWDGKDVFGGASAIVEEAFTPTVKVTTYPTILGIEDLLVDKRIGGVTISVAGKTGSGKSTFCLRYAASLLKRGHPVIIVDGSMPPNDIRKELGTNGIDVVKQEEQGLLILYDGYSEISGIESKEKYKLGSPGELNTINLSLSRNLTKVKNATVFLDSLTAMIEYSDLELAVDFIRTLKVKLQQGDHTAFFILDSNAHDASTLNYINHVMDGEIETVARRTKKGEPERLVSFKRLNGFQIKTGYHQMR